MEISRALKPQKETGKAFHTCIAIRKGKIACIGWNNYGKLHNFYRYGQFENWKGLPGEYKPSLHAECSLCIRMGAENLSDYEILNIRIGNRNQIALSQPCLNCQRILRAVYPKKVFYSTNDEKYCELSLN